MVESRLRHVNQVGDVPTKGHSASVAMPTAGTHGQAGAQISSIIAVVEISGRE